MNDATPHAARAPYRAHEPWSADRPETLVVCCSDGRFHAQLEEFVRHEVSERADLFSVPGGPACVDPWTSSFDEARVFDQAMRIFSEAHDLHSVWLIAHHNCAYYALKHPGRKPEELRALQWKDLRGARKLIEAAHRQYTVRCIFASLVDGVVVFEDVDAPGAAR